MNFCMPGLMSAVGTCRVLAGTCSGGAAVPGAGVSAAEAADAPTVMSAAASIVILFFMGFLPYDLRVRAVLFGTARHDVSDVPFSSATMSDIIGT